MTAALCPHCQELEAEIKRRRQELRRLNAKMRLQPLELWDAQAVAVRLLTHLEKYAVTEVVADMKPEDRGQICGPSTDELEHMTEQERDA